MNIPIPRKIRVENNLRALRTEAGMSQPDIAHALGFKTYERISHWENGKAYPSVLNLLQLAQVLGVPAEKIYTLEE